MYEAPLVTLVPGPTVSSTASSMNLGVRVRPMALVVEGEAHRATGVACKSLLDVSELRGGALNDQVPVRCGPLWVSFHCASL